MSRRRRGRGAVALVGLLVAAPLLAAPAAAQGIDDDLTRQVSDRVVQDVSLDRENVLLALALANNGVEVDLDDLLEGDVVAERVTVVDRSVDLNEETAFSALVLDLDLDDLLVDGDLDASDLDGIDGLSVDGDAFNGIAVGDEQTALVERRVEHRALDLDREEVLLVLALRNGLGAEVGLEDVADMERTVVLTQDLSRQVNIDADDAFLALALERG